MPSGIKDKVAILGMGRVRSEPVVVVASGLSSVATNMASSLARNAVSEPNLPWGPRAASGQMNPNREQNQGFCEKHFMGKQQRNFISFLQRQELWKILSGGAENRV